MNGVATDSDDTTGGVVARFHGSGLFPCLIAGLSGFVLIVSLVAQAIELTGYRLRSTPFDTYDRVVGTGLPLIICAAACAIGRRMAAAVVELRTDAVILYRATEPLSLGPFQRRVLPLEGLNVRYLQMRNNKGSEERVRLERHGEPFEATYLLSSRDKSGLVLGCWRLQGAAEAERESQALAAGESRTYGPFTLTSDSLAALTPDGVKEFRLQPDDIACLTLVGDVYLMRGGEPLGILGPIAKCGEEAEVFVPLLERVMKRPIWVP